MTNQSNFFTKTANFFTWRQEKSQNVNFYRIYLWGQNGVFNIVSTPHIHRICRVWGQNSVFSRASTPHNSVILAILGSERAFSLRPDPTKLKSVGSRDADSGCSDPKTALFT
ncbi:MAG: hypothetical protein HUJ75_05745 [Parasporobacterium sp.]|nr:hypothetical protein [Parasporobacterium sp.]